MVTPFLVGIEVGIQKIREEKQLEDGKHDEKLHQNDDPQALADRAEVPEPVVIESEDTYKDVSLQKCIFC